MLERRRRVLKGKVEHARETADLTAAVEVKRGENKGEAAQSSSSSSSPSSSSRRPDVAGYFEGIASRVGAESGWEVQSRDEEGYKAKVKPLELLAAERALEVALTDEDLKGFVEELVAIWSSWDVSVSLATKMRLSHDIIEGSIPQRIGELTLILRLIAIDILLRIMGRERYLSSIVRHVPDKILK